MTDEKLNSDLAAAVAAVKSREPDHGRMAAAADRVRAELAQPGGDRSADGALNDDAAYIALIPDYLAGHLSESRRMLFEEESRRSLAVRRALQQAREIPESNPANGSGETEGWRNRGRWLTGIAAAFTLAIGFMLVPEMATFDQAELATVRAVEGRLFEVTRAGLSEIAPGAMVDGRARLRTAKGTLAVLTLDDGSTVEINERAEISLLRRFGGNRIDVERGDIIVVASEQGSGTLDVVTDELVVSVTGTIFAVGHGALGSVVSVIEGEVDVSHAGDVSSLTPGQQLGSHVRFEMLDLEDRIAWSDNADTYIAMLGELSELHRDLAQAMASAPRYSTRLLDLAPVGTVVFAALPNAPEKLVELWDTFQARLSESPELRAWIEGQVENISEGASHDGVSHQAAIEIAIGWLRDVGEALGDETAVILLPGADDAGPVPLVLSEVNEAAFRSAFEAIAALADGDGPEVALVDDPSAAVDGQLTVWLSGDLVFASTSRAVLINQAGIVGGQVEPLHGTFVTALRAAYDRGAEFLGAADLTAIPHSSESAHQAAIMGFSNAAHLVVERRQSGDLATLVGELHFDGERQGVAGWLDAPAAMGALSFFSVEATLASAVVVKEPAVLLDEMLAMIQAEGHEIETGVHGVDWQADIVGPLGGEFAMGLDGPALPVPAWKVVVEVYDEQRLQHAIERLIESANVAPQDGEEEIRIVLEPSPVQGYEGFKVSVVRNGAALPTGGHYAYVDGYLVAAPNAALVRRAIDTWQTGSALPTSEAFRSLVPADGQLGFSAVAFHRLGEMVADLMGSLPDDLTTEQQRELARIASRAGPSLSVVYGHEDRIRFVMNGDSEMPLSVAQVLGLRDAMRHVGAALPEMMQGASF